MASKAQVKFQSISIGSPNDTCSDPQKRHDAERLSVSRLAYHAISLLGARQCEGEGEGVGAVVVHGTLLGDEAGPLSAKLATFAGLVERDLVLAFALAAHCDDRLSARI